MPHAVHMGRMHRAVVHQGGGAPWTPAWLQSALAGWWSAKRSPITLAAGMAAQFTAANSEYLSNTGNAALRGPSGTGGWWRAGWANFDSLGSSAAEALISTHDNVADLFGYRILLGSADKLTLIASNGAAVVTATHGSVLTTGGWYFWYAYYDGTNIGISLNGGAAVTTALATFAAGASVFQMGARLGPATYMDGKQQCVCGDNGTLTAGQLTALYNTGTPLSYAQALAAGITFGASTGFYFELNEPSGARVDLVAGYSLTDNNTVTTASGTCLNAVSQEDDMSGLGRHLLQATQASRLAYRINSINGFPALVSDGVDDVLFASFTFAQPYALFFVGKKVVESNNTIMLGGANAGANEAEMLDGGAGSYRLYAGALTSGLTPSPATSPHIYEAWFSGASSTLGIDGVLLTGQNAGVQPPNGVAVGAAGNGAQAAAIANGEIIVMNRLPTASEAAKIRRYLSREWGIAV